MAHKEDDDLELQYIKDNEEPELKENLLKKQRATTAFTGLTKQQLLEVEKRETIWRKLRIILFTLFWVVWFGMLIGAILIIIFTPKCPFRPTLQPWQKSCIYRVNPFAFRDEDGNGVGELVGLNKKLEHITKDLQSDTIILDSIVAGEYGKDYLHLSTDLKSIDPEFGTLEQVKLFVKQTRKLGLTLIATLDINGVGFQHNWAKEKKDYLIKMDKTESKGRNGNSALCSLNGEQYYTSMGALKDGSCGYLTLNLTKTEVLDEIKDVVKFWLAEIGVDGILITNGALLRQNPSLNDAQASSSVDTANIKEQTTGREATIRFLKEIRSVMEELSVVTNKKRVLLFEAGDTTQGVTEGQSDSSEQLLRDSAGKDVVDVVLVSDFLYKRGWKTQNVPAQGTSFRPINQVEYGRIAWSTASPYHQRYDSLEAITGSFLLPGLTVIYMGTEVNMSSINHSLPETPDTIKPLEAYPKGARSISYLYSGANNNDKDVFLSAMFPWDAGNSSESQYRNFFGIEQNLQLLSALGAPPNTFTLIKQLAQLKKTKEALMWGSMDFPLGDPVSNAASNERRLIFRRFAAGFKTIIVVYLRQLADKSGTVLDLSKVCEQGRVQLAYPESSLPFNQTMPLKNVYFGSKSGESLTVLECL